MAKKTTPKKGNLLAGLDKFIEFANARGYEIVEDSYGLYRIVHNGRSSEREAAQAYKVNPDGSATFGWIINIANRERVFKPDGSGFEVYALK